MDARSKDNEGKLTQFRLKGNWMCCVGEAGMN